MSLLRQRWSSRQLTGDAKHALIVRVRPGHMTRGYITGQRRIDDGSTPFNGSPIFPPLIWKGHNHACWKGLWVPTGPWMELPNVENAKWSRSFDVQTGGQQGTATASVVMDNIAFPEEAGIAGLYHAITRGYFSPSRGLTVKTRPKLWSDAANQWQNALNGGYQIELWEGYGIDADVQLKTVIDPVTNSYAPDSGALDRTYTGIVLDCETESHPDKITITAQDFSVFFTDQRVMGRNKAPEVRSPVTFADRKRTQGEQKLDGPYQVSSGLVTGDGDWTSGTDGASGDEEWIEMTLPAGFYNEFFVAPEFSGMRMYVSLHLSGAGSMGVHPLGAGWVTIPGVGGTIGGIPYMWSASPAQSPARRWPVAPFQQLDWQGVNVPNGSKLRLTFSNLHHQQSGGYVAGTRGFNVYRFGNDPSNPPNGQAPIKATGWILVEDAAEVIRMVLIWAGFQEWHVEDFGWSLFAPLLFGADEFFMDIINDMLGQGSFIFYMGPPTNDDRSIGVPHFEHIAALDGPPANVIEVRDTDMTEALQVKWDLSNLPYVMRYRGAISKKGQQLLGVGIGGLVKRFMATYYPPWSGNWGGLLRDVGQSVFHSDVQIPRVAGILRHFTETMGVSVITQLQSDAECLFACVLAAIEYALVMCTARFQIPGLSRLNLNAQMAVVDEASAVNSRMWVSSVESEHEMGGGSAPGYWRMTVSGSLIDTAEMVAIADDYNYAWALNQRHKAAFAG